MQFQATQHAALTFQYDLFHAITSATYNGTRYDNGQKAKEALIRSQNLIRLIHEATKVSVKSILDNNDPGKWTVFPSVGQSAPELKIYGKLKGKDQDLVYLSERQVPEVITDGPNQGEIDSVGISASASSIVVGIRSQMSSVDKNFDTLMERAFAETLNLRLRMPTIVMGEVYVLPLNELDDQAMLQNKVAFRQRPVNVDKFVKTFHSFSGRSDLNIQNQYKYDSTALVFLDLKTNPPKVIFNEHDLANEGYSDKTCELFRGLKPERFEERLYEKYELIQQLKNQV
jgi:hypothetical protein